MKIFYSAGLCFLLSFILSAPEAVAQGTLSAEIFLTIFDEDVNVDVYINGTIAAYGDDISYATNPCSGTIDWLADTDAAQPAPEDCGGNWEDLDGNTKYEIEFVVREAGQPDLRFKYTYFNCESGYDTQDDGFYCPNGVPAFGNNDMYFEYYSGGHMRVEFEGLSAFDYNDATYFSGGTWLMPHQTKAFCERIPSGQGACKSAIDNQSFFLANAFGPSYVLANASLYTDVSGAWYIKDTDLTIYQDSTLYIGSTDTLYNSDMTFSASGSPSDAGIIIGSGKSLALINSMVTGGTTVQNGSLTLSGSHLKNGDFKVNTSTLTIQGADTLTSVDMTIASGKTVDIPSGTTLSMINGSIEGGTVDMDGSLTLNGTTLNRNTMTVDSNNLTIDGTVTFNESSVTISSGKTLIIPATETLSLIGTSGNNTTLTVTGSLTIAGSLTCSSNYVVITNPQNITVTTTGSIEEDCLDFCLLASSGTPTTISSNLTCGTGKVAWILEGASVSITDNTTLTYDVGAVDWHIYRDTEIKMGNDAKMIFNQAVSFPGESGYEIVVKKLDASDEWDYVKLEADGNDFDYVDLSDGHFPIYVHSDSNTLDHIIVHDAYLGILGGGDFTLRNSTLENLTTDGILGINSNMTVEDDTIRDNGGKGVYMLGGTADPFTGNSVTGNGSGTYIDNSANFYIDDNAKNTFKDNDYSELYVKGTGKIYAGDATANDGGQNNIYDSRWPTDTNYFLENATTTEVMAENNYWGELQ